MFTTLDKSLALKRNQRFSNHPESPLHLPCNFAFHNRVSGLKMTGKKKRL